MVTKDPIEIWEIMKSKSGDIVYLVTRDDKKIKKDDAINQIKEGQVYLVSSEDGDNSKIDLVGDDTLRTVKDDTKLNNLTGNSNLKITIMENDSM